MAIKVEAMDIGEIMLLLQDAEDLTSKANKKIETARTELGYWLIKDE